MSVRLSNCINGVKDSNNRTVLKRDYEELGVSPLQDTRVAKKCRFSDSNNTIWPLGYGLANFLYKYRQQKKSIHHNCNNFDKLPEEVILYLFKILDKLTLTKCAYVCQKWRRIAYDESLWQCLNIPHRRMSIMALDNILKRNVKYLSISHSNLYVNIRNVFEEPLPKLQYLDLSAVFIPVDILNSLLSQCHNLIKLSLENCRVDVLCCEKIGRNSNLKVLNLASSSGLDGDGIKHLLKLKNLEELNVSWAHIKVNNLRFLLTNMIQGITHLNISGFLKQLADNDLITLVNRCSRLVELDISDSLAITPDSVDFILNNLPNLKILSMSRCFNVGTSFLQPKMQRLKTGNRAHQLKELNMFGMTNQYNSLWPDVVDLKINKNIFSHISRPKLANNEYTIWEIPAFIDC
ncbi:S-phase kinase-associated protein 2 isoform X2 [Daktulosphaira vitifoliae]|uniref:S-phase kinase-associated protein 2 isoform X2 n=1 Tax=Daktulosphaira vitifoliae TaxID=58002 RepID=UPI0021A9B85E|nr:S-phase kinase-associated protein 2 isoform X2 [Daktulosphaira vitifoliae]XP_050537063.1 S-phase kinase-associated protein 2 isoform X2 [Daktulosphaira vitifoliae]